MYHTSPRVNRAVLETEGLKPATPLGGFNEAGVYLWQDLERHWELVVQNVLEEGFDPVERPFDLWRVDVRDLELEPDRFARLRDHGSCYCKEAIEPARLELVSSFESVACYLGSADLDDLREQLGEYSQPY